LGESINLVHSIGGDKTRRYKQVDLGLYNKIVLNYVVSFTNEDAAYQGLQIDEMQQSARSY